MQVTFDQTTSKDHDNDIPATELVQWKQYWGHWKLIDCMNRSHESIILGFPYNRMFPNHIPLNTKHCTFVQCWTNVGYCVPTLYKFCTIILCLLGCGPAQQAREVVEQMLV